MNYSSLSDRTRKAIFLASGATCAAVVLAAAAFFRTGGAPRTRDVITPAQPESAPAGRPSPQLPSAAPERDRWSVYVTGAVVRPGVYELEPGGRVQDAIRMAGGFSPLADREAVNLAAKVRDEAHISVPRKDGEARSSPENPAPPARARPGGAQPVSYPPGREGHGGSAPIDINKASAAELTSLPGIGPKLSESIVSHREENGPFPSVDSLRDVSGIGEKKLEAIRDLIKAGN